jgi:hypothetical protein
VGEWRGFLEEPDREYIHTFSLEGLMYSGRGHLLAGFSRGSFYESEF